MPPSGWHYLARGAHAALIGRIARDHRAVHGSDIRIDVAACRLVDDAAIVPDHQVPVPPLVAVAEFLAGLVSKETVQDLVGRGFRQPLDTDGEAGRDVQRL